MGEISSSRSNQKQNQVIPTTYGYVGSDFPKLDAFQNNISKMCASVAAAAIVGLVFITAAEVFFRVFFDKPLGWNIGVTEKYLLPLAGFLGVITAYRTGSHIAVSTIFSKLSPRMQKLLLILGYILILGTLISLLIAGWNEFLVSWNLNHRTLPGMSDLPLPDWTYRAIMPVACLLGIPLVAIDLYKELKTSWQFPATDYDGQGEKDA